MNATVNQIGARNDQATIEQAGIGGLGTDGANQTATINQGDADVLNSSRNSTAFIQQFSSFSQQATITQLGNTNTATILQNDNAGPSNVATISQDGNNNVALIDQSDFSTVGTQGTITQTGNNNQADLEQKGVTAPFTSGSYANITQDGNNNAANFQQDGGINNHADITQTGGGNVLQGLGGNTFAIQNGGGGNTLTVLQTSAAGTGAGLGQVAHVSQMVPATQVRLLKATTNLGLSHVFGPG